MTYHRIIGFQSKNAVDLFSDWIKDYTKDRRDTNLVFHEIGPLSFSFKITCDEEELPEIKANIEHFKIIS